MKDFKLKYLSFAIILMHCFTISKADTTKLGMDFADVSNRERSIAKVKFSKLLVLDDVVSLLLDTNSDIAIIESQYSIGSRSIQEFYSLPFHTSAYDVDMHSLKDEYIRHRKSMLNAVLEHSNKDYTLDPNFSKSEMMSMHTNNENTDILVTGVILTGSNNDLSKVIKKRNIQSLDISTIDSIREKTTAKTPVLKYGSKSVGVKASASWKPDSGQSIVFYNSGRYSFQWVKWDTNNFDSNDTYEHDFFLNNYNNNLGTYMDPNSTPWPLCYPQTTYSATTFPAASHPYLDTRLDQTLTKCEDKEIPYTIGAARADAITAGVWHYTYIVTNAGSVALDKFKLNAQKGFRLPTSCYTTWCSFGDENVVLVPSWNVSVPGIVNW